MENNETKKEESTVTKKKNHIPIIIGIIVAVAAIAVVARFFLVSGSEDNKLNDTLQLADNYLGDLDYENAIASYEEAISIDPKSVDAYAGLANTYIAMADDCVANNKYDDAITNLDNAMNAINRGLDNVDSDKADVLNNIQTSIEEKNKTIAADLKKAKDEAANKEQASKDDKKSEKKKSDSKKEKDKEDESSEKDKDNDKKEKDEKTIEEDKETEPEKEIEQPANQTYIDPYGEEWTKEEMIEVYQYIYNIKNWKCDECGGNVSHETYTFADAKYITWAHECDSCNCIWACGGKYCFETQEMEDEDYLCPYCSYDSSWDETYNWILSTGVVN